MGRTRKTRVQLTIEPELGDLLKELAQETNSSLSGLIAELLMEMAPVLEKNLELMKMASKLKGSGQQRVKAHLEATLKIMEEEVAQGMKALDHLTQ